MKKIWMFLFTICLIVSAFSINAVTTAQAAGDNTVILFEGTEQSDDEVKIDVNVSENSGVYSMLLTLEYDRSALELKSLEYGTAFSSLEPFASGDLSLDPFRITYLGTGKQNDVSTGKMMTLTFSVKENAPDGDYTVTFSYERNKDVTYLDNGEIKTKNLVIGATKIKLKGSEVDEVVTDDGNSDGKNETPAYGCRSSFSMLFVKSEGGAL